MSQIRPALFTRPAALQKVRELEDACNSRDPAVVVKAFTLDTRWRSRAEFLWGRDQVESFLTRKWRRELGYRIVKELWAVDGDRLSLSFCYEHYNDSGQWFRAFGTENLALAPDGLVSQKVCSINEHPIAESERKLRWPLGRRPDEHPGLSDLDF